MTGLRQPRLLIELRLEEDGRLFICADSHEDEIRLRQWLRRTTVLEALEQFISEVLDLLDNQGCGESP
jgi:hypothetical protein